ncbi:hypothetical protein PRIPAC_81814 [Pristionchus pacificus]|uniref:Uncharacterized protein n=1 Tax=Pristionchus pacificus TaxID=54126 RepID=A0A2A6CJN5_PRIPA|nr:hypothetical protein PRIPAC_81814 [Pristionchus pacificus]|eukprot:PDM78316.1 hypothetical protein PRIPAC_30895 [Pristionchus pacificus]
MEGSVIFLNSYCYWIINSSHQNINRLSPHREKSIFLHRNASFADQSADSILNSKCTFLFPVYASHFSGDGLELYLIQFMPLLLGGGYCAGLLCIMGQNFHIGLAQFLLCLCFVAGAFSMLTFHKNQILMPPTSKIRVGRRLKIAVYVISHLLLISMPIIFSLSNTSSEVQNKFIDHCKFGFLTWRERNLTWGIIVISQDSLTFNALIFSMTANLSIFGSATSLLLIHTMWMILRFPGKFMFEKSFMCSHSNKTAHNIVRQKAKITNVSIVFSQLIVAFFLLVLPLSLIMLQISQQIPAKAIIVASGNSDVASGNTEDPVSSVTKGPSVENSGKTDDPASVLTSGKSVETTGKSVETTGKSVETSATGVERRAWGFLSQSGEGVPRVWEVHGESSDERDPRDWEEIPMVLRIRRVEGRIGHAEKRRKR